MTTPLFSLRIDSLSRLHYAPTVLSCALGLLQLACAAGPALTPAPLVVSPGTGVSPLLELGKTAERELAGGQTDEIRFRLEANQYVRLILDQKHLDVVARLLGPQGEPIATADGPGWRQVPELISLVTTAEGEYQLLVTPHEAGAANSRYAVKLDEVRPAQPEDGDRVRAETALSEAIHYRVSGQEGSLARALADAEEALSSWQKIGNAAGEIAALLELAEIHFRTNDEPKVRELLQQALSLSVATHDRLGEAKALRLLATFVDLGAERRAYFERALEIARQLGEVGEQANILFERGSFEFSQSKFSEALAFFQQALGFAESVEAYSLAARIWNGIGGVHTSRGESGEALTCYDRALTLARQAGNRPAEAATLTGIGVLLRRRGELQSALTHLLTALDLNQRLGDRKDQGQVLLQLGVIYLNLGDTDQALRYYDQARELFHSVQDRSLEGLALIQLGVVYSQLKEWHTALERFNQAWAISSAAGHTRRMAAELHGMGIAQLNLGQTAEAIQSLERALALQRDVGDRLGEASTLLELGKIYQDRGDLERAVSLMEEALQIAKEVETSFGQAAALFNLAKLERDRQNLQQALTYIERSIQILESARSNLGDRLRASFFASRRSYYDFYVDLLMRMGHPEKALEASERGRARSLLDLLSERRIDLTQGISPELKRQEADLAARLSEIQGDLMDELSKKGAKEEKIADLRARLDEIVSEREKLEVRIRSEHPRYAEVRYPSPLGLEAIQKQLSEDEALLEYSLGQEGAYLFVVTREQLEVHRLADASRIANEVRAVRDGVERPSRQSFSSYVLAAHQLYETLIAPVRAILAGKRRLLISPDGPLHFLAFEVLLTGGHGREVADFQYLIRDFSVSYIPSASVLSWLAKPQASLLAGSALPKRFVAFADPFYGPAKSEPIAARAGRGADLARGASSQDLGLGPVPRLKGTAREVAAIAALYPSVEVQLYEGAQANEENVKGNPLVEKARRIHFATHGVFNERQPELSGLRLTRTVNEDGILQVHEIFNLNLTAELVVLSACDTGSGQQVSGEGLIGLTRAFLYAGTPSVVVSLWPVADTSAPDLMLHFYKSLDQSGDKAEALRQAKLWMIRQRSYMSRPFYWAPFILVGLP